MSESGESIQSLSRLWAELEELEREIDAGRHKNGRDRRGPEKLDSRKWRRSRDEIRWQERLLAELRTLRHLVERHRECGRCKPRQAAPCPPCPPFPPYPPYPPFPPYPPYPPVCAPPCSCGTVPCSCRTPQPPAPCSSSKPSSSSSRPSTSSSSSSSSSSSPLTTSRIN